MTFYTLAATIRRAILSLSLLLVAAASLPAQVLLNVSDYINSEGDESGDSSFSYSFIAPANGILSYSLDADSWATLSGNETQVSANQTVYVTVGRNGGYGGDFTLVVTFAASPPAITSSLTATGQPGVAFNYTITATNSPTSYDAVGLPSGLGVNPATGVISGTPTGAGTYNVTITATNGGGATSNTLALVVGTPQSITFNLGNQTLATPTISLNGTASSGLPISYSVLSGPAMITGSTLFIHGEGTISVRATQAGGIHNSVLYTAAAAVDRTFTVTKASQVITFPNPGTRSFGEIFSPGASAPSGLPISYTVVSGPAAIYESDKVLITGAGTVSLRASQAGNWAYTAASDVTVSFLSGSGSPVADTLVSTTTYSYVGKTAQTYAVPGGADYVVIKAWGGGGGGRGSVGGTGALTIATYDAYPGEEFTVIVAGGGGGSNSNLDGVGGWPGGGAGRFATGGGGGHSSVLTPRGSVWAAGGGGGGSVVGTAGGPGGAPNGLSGNGIVAGPGGTQTSGGIALASLPQSAIPGGLGSGGGFGAGGDGGGGGGGSGYYGGASGGYSSSGVSGGGGGSSIALGAAIYKSYQLHGGYNDPDFVVGTALGQGVAGGGNGRVVIKAYKYNSHAAPVITSGSAVMARPGQQIDYWIAALRHPSGYAAVGLPAGLALNTTTGRITGSVASAGNYSSTLTATNSTGSSPATAVTWKIDGTPPNLPVGLAAQSGSIGQTSFVVTWSPTTDAQTAVASYEVRCNGASVGETIGTSLQVAGLVPGASHAIAVRACDSVGNWSDWSSSINVTTAADTTPPSVPGALILQSRGSYSLELAWSAAVDDDAVAEYEVSANGSSVGTALTTAKTIGNLLASTTYALRVRARDTAGNWSPWSAPLNAATAPGGADTLIATKVFTSKGSVVQDYRVPPGANYVVVKAWGAGGGGGQKYSSSFLGNGGNGGFATASYSVVAGDQFTVSVGTGGRNNGMAGWPGGGVGAASGTGGGGGYSSVQTPYGALWAGAGGGGSWGPDGSASSEGFGGGGGGGTTSLNVGGLLGDYYSGIFGVQQFSRVDSRISWETLGLAAPFPGFSAPYSVRWMGQIRPRFTELYRIGLTTIHGTTRIWINGQLIVNESGGDSNWHATTKSERWGSIALNANQRYDIKVEYEHSSYSSYGFANLWWQSPSQTTETIPSLYLFPTSASIPGNPVPGAGTNGAGWNPSGGQGGGATAAQGGTGGNGGIAGSLGQGGNGSINGNGGGGGGYYGGGGGRGGGGGSSHATGAAYNVRYLAASGQPGGANETDYPGNTIGVGGYLGDAGASGGNGAVIVYAYQAPGSNLTQTYFANGASQTFTVPAGADYVIVKAWGAGAGGSGSSGAGGGFVTATYTVTANQTITINAGSAGAPTVAGTSSIVNLPFGTTITAAGGGSGASSGITVGSQAPTSSQVLAPTGSTPAATGDINYPGSNVGYGGSPSGTGGKGAVVLIVHIAAPSINSSQSVATTQNTAINYTITGTGGPTAFSATNLPDGLALNPTTGVISGKVAVPGTYSSTIFATNRGGTGQKQLDWTINPDTSAPTVPGTLSAQNITFNSLVLSWAPATDDVGVTAYEVRRDSVIVGTFATASATLTGLLPATSYWLSVRARDAAGNWSGWSGNLAPTTASVPVSGPSGSIAFLQPATFQTYTVPSGVGRLLIKAWGGGGDGATGNTVATNGGAGAFVTATYDVTPGQIITIWPADSAGGASYVGIAGQAFIYVGGGGGGGHLGDGGAAGGPNGSAGQNGSASTGSSGGGGSSIDGNGNSVSIPGGGGPGDAMSQPRRWVEGGEGEEGYWEDDGPANSVGGGAAGGTTSLSTLPALGGQAGDSGDGATYIGGKGGSGWTGGGGGGTGDTVGGGGGGGGSSTVRGSLAPVTSSMVAGAGAAAPNTSDPSYPGNNVGFGGINGGGGGKGAVVIVTYPAGPQITSPLNPTFVQNQPINYTITTSPAATSFAVSNLPPGLSLDPATGVISGAVAAVGSYSTTIIAANAGGQGQSATVAWSIVADSAAPAAPAGLQATVAGSNALVLSWNAPTDNGAVAAYEVRRDSTSLGTTGATSFTMVGVPTGTAYAYSVRASDAAGNWSAWSTPLNVTLSSGSSGPIPLNYADRTASTVTLMWAAVPASFSYKVYRNGALVATVTDNAWLDSGLSSNTTYSYTVVAVNAMDSPMPGIVSISVTTTGDFSADTDHDGVPDSIEALLTTNPGSPGTLDGTNLTQLKIQRPAR